MSFLHEIGTWTQHEISKSNKKKTKQIETITPEHKNAFNMGNAGKTSLFFSALEQSHCLFWSSSSSFMFLEFAYKCRCCHEELSDQMLAFLVPRQFTIIHGEWTLIAFGWRASHPLKNINIDWTKPCLVLVHLWYSFFFFTVSYLSSDLNLF